jgi:hypothetical protein
LCKWWGGRAGDRFGVGKKKRATNGCEAGQKRARPTTPSLYLLLLPWSWWRGVLGTKLFCANDRFSVDGKKERLLGATVKRNKKQQTKKGRPMSARLQKGKANPTNPLLAAGLRCACASGLWGK